MPVSQHLGSSGKRIGSSVPIWFTQKKSPQFQRRESQEEKRDVQYYKSIINKNHKDKKQEN